MAFYSFTIIRTNFRDQTSVLFNKILITIFYQLQHLKAFQEVVHIKAYSFS